MFSMESLSSVVFADPLTGIVEKCECPVCNHNNVELKTLRIKKNVKIAEIYT